MDASKGLNVIKPLNLVDKYTNIVLVYGVGAEGGEMGKIEVQEGTLVVQIDFNRDALSRLKPSPKDTPHSAILRRVGEDDPERLNSFDRKVSTILALNFLDEHGFSSNPVYKENEKNFENIVREWHRLLKPEGKVLIGAWITPEDASFARTWDYPEEEFKSEVISDWETARSHLKLAGYKDGELVGIKSEWNATASRNSQNPYRISRMPFLLVLTKI